MKPARRIWVWPLLGLFAVAWIVASSPEHPYETPFTGSSQDTGTGGGAALARWLPRVGFDLVSLEQPLPRSLDRLAAKSGNCLLSLGDDWDRPEKLGDADWAELRGWIERGNSLVVVTGSPRMLPKAFFAQLLRLDRSLLTEAPAKGTEPERESLEVALPGASAKLVVNGRGTRSKWDPATFEAAGDGRGSVYHRFAVGKGAVVVLLDNLAFSNDGLDAVGNPEGVQALLRRELRGGALALDEARHHSHRTESYLVALAGLPGARLELWFGGLVLALFILTANVRFGPALAYVLPERRSAREYVEAMAGIYERARGAPLMVEAVAARTAQLARRRGQQGQAALAEAAELAARYLGGGQRERTPWEAMKVIAALLAARRAVLGAQRSEG